MRLAIVLLSSSIAAAALAGCDYSRSTAGNRADITPGAGAKSDIVTVEMDGSIRSSVKIEGSVSRVENGFLVVQVNVRNTTGRNVPCEWRTQFQDKDGFDIAVPANPWSPVVINSNETAPLAKTAPATGAAKAIFQIREAAPIRK